jgi:hypothetical protein
MSTETNPGAQPPLVVFRPRRRCGRCGLVNADLALRCRRCRAPFAGIDPASESERLLRRVRAQRAAAAAVVVLAVVAVAAVAFGMHLRSREALAYGERFRTLAADLAALERGARSDARAIGRAFDDAEARAALADQAGAWAERARSCAALRGRLRGLVSPGPEDAKRQMDLDARAGALADASSAVAGAAAAGDSAAARRVAEKLAGEALE